jgi:glycerol kinase
MLFDRRGSIVSIAQKEFQQIYPHPGRPRPASPRKP